MLHRTARPHTIHPHVCRTPLHDTLYGRYYTGRLAAYDEDFQKADEHLSYAFEHCAGTAAVNNVRRVLRYLIPVGYGILCAPGAG